MLKQSLALTLNSKYNSHFLSCAGKITLAPWQPEPRVAFANDSFGYNTDTMAMNTVGTYSCVVYTSVDTVMVYHFCTVDFFFSLHAVF